VRAAAKTTLVLVLAVASPAAAQPSEADDAFKKARELFKAGQYAQACEQFERSQELDPQLGTQFNLAQCDEKIGKLATALALYKQVATRDTNAERRKFAADLAAKLTRRVPKIVVSIAGDPDRLKVELDGKPLAPNVASTVDLGTYKLVVTANGMREVTARPSPSSCRSSRRARASKRT
jgi:tetratricopeptide (TPR) repeat protein